MDLKELQQVVQDAIEKGAKTVEQVHRQIANMPLDVLARFEQLEAPLNQARDFNDRTIGSIYEAIHNLNQKAGEIAKELLAKIDPSGKSES
ncbi:MAG: hypothetical protein H7A23_10330 [Leptospiraceae bacterium]|nr:hypothetical protein [Leptospiraceae bacterium]MCP5494940.1 hypothetical protein [Leptospiraceae bacterium]